MNAQPRPGTTLLELLCGLALLGLLLGMVSLPAAYAGDVLGARAARSSITAAAASARAVAVLHGGAELHIAAADGALAVLSRDGAVADTIARLVDAHRVSIDLGGPATAALRFDALGIGRLANRTITIRRGRVTAGVTFSAYGRARPW